jgi:hypothetical protein
MWKLQVFHLNILRSTIENPLQQLQVGDKQNEKSSMHHPDFQDSFNQCYTIIAGLQHLRITIIQSLICKLLDTGSGLPIETSGTAFLPQYCKPEQQCIRAHWSVHWSNIRAQNVLHQGVGRNATCLGYPDIQGKEFQHWSATWCCLKPIKC